MGLFLWRGGGVKRRKTAHMQPLEDSSPVLWVTSIPCAQLGLDAGFQLLQLRMPLPWMTHMMLRADAA